MMIVISNLRNHAFKCSTLFTKLQIPRGNQYGRQPCRAFRVKTDITVFELTQGAGGSEAGLFASELLGVYINYFLHMQFAHEIIQMDEGALKSLRRVMLEVQGPKSFNSLIQEAGVHRVQRVPKTEKSGRMHTSTVTVAVTPKSILDIKIAEKDIDIFITTATGPGGQFVNRTKSAVRMVHRPTGTVAECQQTRSQLENRKIALKKLKDRIQMNELEKIESQVISLRKSQIGQANRNEKIRTYNFPQDRLTDHRIGKSYQNLKSLFAGDVNLLSKVIKDFHEPPDS